MAVILACFALGGVPCEPARGGHAETLPSRGGHALVVTQPVEHLWAWTCIHEHEGAWNANTGNGYHGGLQMDWPFMHAYGPDMIRRHGGVGAESWTPREQIVVAERAYDSGRGFAPWPQTARACGVL